MLKIDDIETLLNLMAIPAFISKVHRLLINKCYKQRILISL